MNNFCFTLTIVLGVILPTTAPVAQEARGFSTNASFARIRTNFTGTLVMKREGAEQGVPVSLYSISMDDHKMVRNLEALSSGLALIQFHSGKIETKVNERTNRTKGGEFLVLQASERAVFATADDSATFHAIVFGGALATINLQLPESGLIYPRQEKYGGATNGEPLKIQNLPLQQIGVYYLEAEDLLVGPSQKTGNFTFPGAALLEIRSGNGLLSTLGKSQKVHGGTVLTLTEGQSLKLANSREDLGLYLHATILRAK